MSGTSSLGFLLKLRTGTGPDVFTTIAQAQKITPPKYVRNFEDVRITETEFPEAIPTTLEGIEVPLTLLWSPDVPATPATAHDAMRTALLAKTLSVWQLILPPTGAFQFQFSAYVKEYGLTELTAEGTPISAELVLKLSALPTVTP